MNLTVEEGEEWIQRRKCDGRWEPWKRREECVGDRDEVAGRKGVIGSWGMYLGKLERTRIDFSSDEGY